jgi:hypothetical protein
MTQHLVLVPEDSSSSINLTTITQHQSHVQNMQVLEQAIIINESEQSLNEVEEIKADLTNTLLDDIKIQ